jgi:integrase
MGKYKIILKKVKPIDTIGVLQVQYFNGKGIKKQISLSLKISEENFKKFYDDEFKQFRKNNLFDYKFFNSKIQSKLDTLETEPTKSSQTTNIISFLKEREVRINNLNTRSGLTTLINHLTSFLKSKNVNDIDVNEIDINFLLDFKIYLSNRDITGSTILYYFIVLKGELNYLNSENRYSVNLKYLFKKLNLKKISKHKNTLTNEDINKLISSPKDYKYFNYIQIGLLQLFGLGMRQSDTLLIRYEDFKNDGIVISTKKNKKQIKIPFENKQLLTIISNILEIKLKERIVFVGKIAKKSGRIDFNQTSTPVSKWDVLDKKTDLINTWNDILDVVKTKPKKELIFNTILNIPELETYSKNIEMNEVQLKKWKSFCVKYNYRLKMIQKDLKLDIDNLSSHTFRYTFTKLMMEGGIGIHEISQVLSHSSISITENYINRNFDVKKIKEMNDKIFSQFET